ncbi:hypothetical protein Tco_0180566 [Tanacetum coccineum]
MSDRKLTRQYMKAFRGSNLETYKPFVKNVLHRWNPYLGSLERGQEHATITFGALWQPVLALEAWAGQTDAQRAALWQDRYEDQRERRALRMQHATDQREMQGLREHVAILERRMDHFER